MEFNFDTEVQGDTEVMQKVCAVLAGADAKTVTTDVTEKKVVVEVPDKVVEKLVEKIKEETAAPAVVTGEEPEATYKILDPLTATDEEMSKMKTDDLLEWCDQIDIDPKKTAGVNTNKKIRTLILEWQKKQGAAPTPASTEEEDDEDEAPAATPAKDTVLEPMGLVEARLAIEPFYKTTEKKEIVQKLMIEHGAKKENAAGQTVCSLGVLDAEGKDYRPLVNAVVNYPYGK